MGNPDAFVGCGAGRGPASATGAPAWCRKRGSAAPYWQGGARSPHCCCGAQGEQHITPDPGVTRILQVPRIGVLAGRPNTISDITSPRAGGRRPAGLEGGDTSAECHRARLSDEGKADRCVATVDPGAQLSRS